MALTKVKGSGLATGAATASLVGIDDNATSTAITISAAEAVTFASDVTVGGELNLTAASNNFIDYTDALHIRAAGSSPAYEDSIYCAKDSQVEIKHNGSTKLATTSTGVDVTGDVTVNTGNLVIGTSGKGIDFSAVSDGSRSVSSNLLDDYEEGTWTPGLSGGTAGYAVRVGNYTKIGNTVRLRCSIKLSSWAGTGAVAVTGVPFASVATGYNHDWGVAMMTNKPNSKTWLTGGDGSTSIFFRQQDVTNGDTALAHTDIDADTAIMFTIVYMTA
mgnify:FL=1